MEERNFYGKLIGDIMRLGKKEPKRHGYYYTLVVFDNWQLKLDTWNKSIIQSQMVSSAYLNSMQIGIDFGEFKCHLPMTKFWLAHIAIRWV